MHNRVSPWSSESQPVTTKWLGDYGELVAASYLRAQGYKLLRRNFRWGDSGEIDIVMRDGATLVFVEVKTRRSREFLSPLAAVGKEKRALLRHGARQWLTLLWRDDIPTRFDVVELVLKAQSLPDLVHHKGLFR
ncbi:MAG: YraN family protein [Akkermansia sp.]